jgi:hypothetical protein
VDPAAAKRQQRICFVVKLATVSSSCQRRRRFSSGRLPALARTARNALCPDRHLSVQRNLEDVQAALYPERTLLRPRHGADGAAYWPSETHDYFSAVGTSLEAELARYDAVIFFETAARGGITIEGGNPIRNESNDEAVKLDGKLRALWSRHPRFILVPHNPSFFKKISFGLAALEGIVAQLNGEAAEKAEHRRSHRKLERPGRNLRAMK